MIPAVAAFPHRDLAAGAPNHDHVADRGRLLQGLVGIGLERHRPARPQALIGGDHQTRIAIGDPTRQAVGREAAEHHRMDRPDPGAGQHGIGHFRDHRQIDGDPVALLDAPGLQHIGEAADFFVQLPVADPLAVLGIVALPDDRGLVAAPRQMPVDAVGRDIQRAVLEPSDMQIVRLPGDIAHPGERLHPVQPPRFLPPEPVRVLNRFRITRAHNPARSQTRASSNHPEPGQSDRS